MSTIEEVADEVLAVWRCAPATMVRHLFKAEPDAWQKQALDAWGSPEPRVRVALQACAGPGKSTVEAWCGWNAMLTRSNGVDHPNGAAVSITADNLKNNLWKELAVWYEKSPVLKKVFEMTSTRIFARGFRETWRLDARSFAKTADAEAQGRTLSGLHAKSIFYLLDESGDMPPSIGRAADQGLTNCEWGRQIQAGNPTSHLGLLYQSVTDGRWKVVRITGDPDDPDRSPRIDLEETRQLISLYGRDNPWVMAYILGKFPPSSVNALLGPDEVRDAMKRHLRPDQYEFSQKRLGIDVARFGDDRTILFPRQGLAAFKPVPMRNARTEQISARVALAHQKWGFELALIDATGGYGAGVEDACTLAGIPIMPVYASGAPDDVRFFNKRSEVNFRAAEWVKSGALPYSPGLIREATAVTYWFDKGKLRVTEKDQIKKLLNGQSPDEWDALCQTFAIVDQPASLAALTGGVVGDSNRMKSEWDPHGEDR